MPSLDVVLDQTREAVHEQSERISSLDTKLGVLLGLSGVMLAALVSSPSIRSATPPVRIMLIVAVALIFCSLLAAAWGYWIRKYQVAPDPMILRQAYLSEAPEETKLALVDYLATAYVWNQRRIVSKVWCTHISFILLLIGATTIGVTVMVSLL